jgi:hypothetical protein
LYKLQVKKSIVNCVAVAAGVAASAVTVVSVCAKSDSIKIKAFITASLSDKETLASAVAESKLLPTKIVATLGEIPGLPLTSEGISGNGIQASVEAAAVGNASHKYYCKGLKQASGQDATVAGAGVAEIKSIRFMAELPQDTKNLPEKMNEHDKQRDEQRDEHDACNADMIEERFYGEVCTACTCIAEAHANPRSSIATQAALRAMSAAIQLQQRFPNLDVDDLNYKDMFRDFADEALQRNVESDPQITRDAQQLLADIQLLPCIQDNSTMQAGQAQDKAMPNDDHGDQETMTQNVCKKDKAKKKLAIQAAQAQDKPIQKGLSTREMVGAGVKEATMPRKKFTKDDGTKKPTAAHDNSTMQADQAQDKIFPIASLRRRQARTNTQLTNEEAAMRKKIKKANIMAKATKAKSTTQADLAVWYEGTVSIEHDVSIDREAPADDEACVDRFHHNETLDEATLDAQQENCCKTSSNAHDGDNVDHAPMTRVMTGMSTSGRQRTSKKLRTEELKRKNIKPDCNLARTEEFLDLRQPTQPDCNEHDGDDLAPMTSMTSMTSAMSGKQRTRKKHHRTEEPKQKRIKPDCNEHDGGKADNAPMTSAVSVKRGRLEASSSEEPRHELAKPDDAVHVPMSMKPLLSQCSARKGANRRKKELMAQKALSQK